MTLGRACEPPASQGQARSLRTAVSRQGQFAQKGSAQGHTGDMCTGPGAGPAAPSCTLILENRHRWVQSQQDRGLDGEVRAPRSSTQAVRWCWAGAATLDPAGHTGDLGGQDFQARVTPSMCFRKSPAAHVTGGWIG